MITEEQLELLGHIKEWCDEGDKSNKFMIDYMIDVTNLDRQVIIDYINGKY